MNQDMTEVGEVSDKLATKKAIIISEMEYMEKNMERIKTFISNNEGREISNIDEFISPEDDADDIISFLADEKACEETMELIKEEFRKKKISLEEYLDAIRALQMNNL
jgi:hypothetical protein